MLRPTNKHRLKVVVKYYVIYLTDPLKVEIESLGSEDCLSGFQTWRDPSLKRRIAAKRIENLKKDGVIMMFRPTRRKNDVVLTESKTRHVVNFFSGFSLQSLREDLTD